MNPAAVIFHFDYNFQISSSVVQIHFELERLDLKMVLDQNRKIQCFVCLFMTGSIIFGVMFTIIAIYEWIQVFEMNCSRVSVTHLPNKIAVCSKYPEIFGTYSQINGSKINFRNLYQSDFDDGKHR